MKLSYELSEAAKISWVAINANKLRAALTTLGIIIGVATVSLMGSAITGLKRTFEDSLSLLGADVLFVEKFDWVSKNDWREMRNRPDITLRDAKRLERELELAQTVSVEAQSQGAVSYEERSASSAHLIGANESTAMVRGFLLSEGRFFTESDVDGLRPVCVVGSLLAENLFPHSNPLGKRIKIRGKKYDVIGVLEKMGGVLFGDIDNQVVVPVTRFATDFAYNPGVSISVKAVGTEQLEDTRIELRGAMRKIRRLAPDEKDNFAINQQSMLMDAFMQTGGTIAAGGLLITGLSLLVGGIGIMNIMFVSVLERTQEIGLRKALGAKQRTILIQFLLEASFICLFGGLLGLVLAYPVTLLMQQAFPATLAWPVVLTALVVSILTGLVSGYLPAHRAAKLNPVDALRQE
ncbi:MAG: Macrolide export ATP-binding/permease protein MacB [Verrucomicrobia subdivision 3 bacterium]|nr:Macrolide export ATP-binding/permease protein MacB [Limisphaerales bacterium]MCS1414995.1 Macrolide export ATP-binding/permease protein MacB [Limisphaerales bacterium]